MLKKSFHINHTRACPECKSILFYSDKYKLQRAVSNNCKCLSCCNKGRKISEATRLKLSNSHKGHPSNKLRIGVKHSEERKRKISLTKLGSRASEATKKKMSLAQKGKPHSEQHIHNVMLALEKSKYKRKPYDFGGSVILIQGYENLTLDKLIAESISTDNIKVHIKDKPRIQYNWNGKSHWYYPDCYLSDSNTIVETKSDWTWKSSLDRNIAKIESSQKEGYNVRVIIWNGKKELVSDTIYKA